MIEKVANDVVYWYGFPKKKWLRERISCSLRFMRKAQEVENSLFEVKLAANTVRINWSGNWVAM